MSWRIYNDDCNTIIKRLISKNYEVDAIFTDPPYNISKKNNFKTMNRAGIDFGEWDKDFDLTSWIYECEPLLKKGGNIVIFNSWKNMSYITTALTECGFEIKDLIRWVKTNPMPRNRNRRFITDYEVAVWAVKKGNKWNFNRASDKYEIPEIKGPITSKSEKIYGAHPTQKPIYVMEWIIKRLSNEGDIILDPFMGTGTTGVACINTDRDFIGIELNEDYFNIARQRLSIKGEE